MDFIPKLRDVIVSRLEDQNIPAETVYNALEQWDRGLEPRNPIERGCFAVFEKIEADIKGK